MNESGTDRVFGVGARFSVTKDLAIRAEWERFQNVGKEGASGRFDIDLLSVNLMATFKQPNGGLPEKAGHVPAFFLCRGRWGSEHSFHQYNRKPCSDPETLRIIPLAAIPVPTPVQGTHQATRYAGRRALPAPGTFATTLLPRRIRTGS